MRFANRFIFSIFEISLIILRIVCRSGQPNPKAPKDNPVVDFDLCAASIKRHALPLINPKPVTLKHHQISAFSYFFERSIETGLIGKLKSSLWNMLYLLTFIKTVNNYIFNFVFRSIWRWWSYRWWCIQESKGDLHHSKYRSTVYVPGFNLHCYFATRWLWSTTKNQG